jgi:hypothetical protein
MNDTNLNQNQNNELTLGHDRGSKPFDFNLRNVRDVLFSNLNEREITILNRRYGLNGDEGETLEGIGDTYKLTRERVRQIENASLKKVLKHPELEKQTRPFGEIIADILKDHGGLLEKDYTFNLLSRIYKIKDEEKEGQRNLVDFLINRLFPETGEVHLHDYFLDAYKLKSAELDKFENIVKELLSKIEEEKRTLSTVEMINVLKNDIEESKKLLEEVNKRKEDSDEKYKAYLPDLANSELHKENIDFIHDHLPLYAIIRTARDINQNKFGHWGASHWEEINPKTVNKKIYMVLKRHGQPLHFNEIAQKINEVGFDDKIANPATVHNELILSDKYVLVGRGVYSLNDWGYASGTVADIIERILEKEAELSREDIIKKVLDQRAVKAATINLALNNREKFAKTNEGYKLKK